MPPIVRATMKITNHKLDGVEFQQARWIGGAITPTLVVLHDTAGQLTHGNSAAYLRSNEAKVSVHFVIEVDGTIVQQVPTNRTANHAGPSSFHGRSGCNDFSIGIEIVNPGRMTAAGSEFARPWWGGTFNRTLFGIEEVSTPQHGSGLWMHYSQEQIRAVLELLEVLFRDVLTLTDITTHWYVSPGRKTDTNPLFPIDVVRARILGRSDPADIEADAGSRDAEDGTMVFIGAKSGLNMRRWPNWDNPNVILTIPHAEIVPVLRRGEFARREWLLVFYAGQRGWVLDAYTQPVN